MFDDTGVVAVAVAVVLVDPVPQVLASAGVSVHVDIVHPTYVTSVAAVAELAENKADAVDFEELVQTAHQKFRVACQRCV